MCVESEQLSAWGLIFQRCTCEMPPKRGRGRGAKAGTKRKASEANLDENQVRVSPVLHRQLLAIRRHKSL